MAAFNIKEFFSKLSEKERKILYVTIVFVVFAVLDRVFLGPVTVRLKAIDEDIDEQKNIIKRDLRILAYKDRIIKENNDFSTFFTGQDSKQEEIIASFLKKIEVLATDAKVNLVKVSPSETQQRKGFVEYYANLECEGNLVNVVAFMHAVDTAPDLLKVVKYTMSPKKAGSDDVSAVMTVTKAIINPAAMDEIKTIVKGEKAEEKLKSKKEEKDAKAKAPGPEGEEPKDSPWEKILGKVAPKKGGTPEGSADENADEAGN